VVLRGLLIALIGLGPLEVCLENMNPLSYGFHPFLESERVESSSHPKLGNQPNRTACEVSINRKLLYVRKMSGKPSQLRPKPINFLPNFHWKVFLSLRIYFQLTEKEMFYNLSVYSSN